jgi:hypothetical protein
MNTNGAAHAAGAKKVRSRLYSKRRRTMARDKRRTGTKTKRQPPVKIPLPFEQAVKGFLALSPEDAREVRESRPDKRTGGKKEG